jgi:hypothetical protein
MFEIVIISGRSLQSVRVSTLREALKVRCAYANMGLATRIWPV